MSGQIIAIGVLLAVVAAGGFVVHYGQLQAERSELRHRAQAYAVLDAARTEQAEHAARARAQAATARAESQELRAQAQASAAARAAQATRDAALRARLAEVERDQGPQRSCPNVCYALTLDGDG